jgi:iron complex outermembrane receptor protein
MTTRARWFTFAAASACAASLASAQTATPPPKPDETVVLSEFTVAEATDNSYVAAESITGTRVRTPIKDLTFNVNVITSEFLNDFAFFEINESSFAYTSALSNFDNGGGNVNMRGYGATSFLRNGFLRLGLVDRVNVDRIEVIKGPSAAIYGMTTPAGMVNIITKKPRFDRARQDLSVSAGDYDTSRVDFNAAGPLHVWGDTAYAVSAGFHERTFDTPWNMTRTKTASLGLQHKFGQRGSLLVEVEWLARRTNPGGAIPFRVVSTAPATQRVQGLATELKFFNQNGPNSEQNRDVSSVNLTYEGRLSDIWSVRVGGAAFHRHSLTFNNGNSTTFDVLTRRITGRTVSKGWINEDGAAVQMDLLAHTKWFRDAVDSKTLFTLDHSQYWKYNPTKQLPNNVNSNAAFYSANLSVDNPDYRVPEFDAAVYTNLNRKLVTRVDVNGGFLREQFTTFGGKLIGVIGTRVDNVTFNFWDKRNNTVSHFHDFQLSPMIGLNYKLTPQVALYANRTNSFSPNAQRASAGLNASETAHGIDYGFKTGFFQDKLQFTLGGFYINRVGVTVTELDASGQQVDTNAGNQNAKGVEFDFTWRATSDLTFLGGYGYVNAKITANGRDLDSIGRRPGKIPATNFGLAMKYNLPGALKGVIFNAGVTYIGDTFPDSTGGGITEGASSPRRGFVLSNDGRRDLKLPSYTVVDFGLAYRLRPANSHYAHTLRLNVKNALEEDYIDINKKPGDTRAIFVTYAINH